MDLEKVLAEDRVAFETKVATETDQATQLVEGIKLRDRFIGDVHDPRTQVQYLVARIDAFMGLCIKYKVCKELVMHTLRASYSGSNFTNRDALIAYFKTFPSVGPLYTGNTDIHSELPQNSEYFARKQGLFEMLGEQQMTTMRPSRAKVVELEKLCQEYQDWLRSIRLGSVKADPKNYPTKDQLRVRDGIREKILAAATPDLILQLAMHALHHGDLNE